jgi:DNA-binding XRE family transcriptional regulator
MKRFWDKVDRSRQDGCWYWTGYLDPNGYGRIRWRGEARLAHRVSWELLKGAPGALCVLHKCDTPRCVNPDHLFLGDKVDNTRDMCRKRRNNGKGVHLSYEDAKAIRERYADGVTQRELADKYGVTRTLICMIVKGHIWKPDVWET